MEVEITTKNFETYKNGELPLVVDLWATWCGPCRMVAPIISELAQEYDGKLVVGKCDVEENDDIAMEFGCRCSLQGQVRGEVQGSVGKVNDWRQAKEKR